jgi:hypothetical protein
MRLKATTAIIAGLALVAWAPGEAEAQETRDQKRFDAEIHGGLTIPTGELRDVTDAGPTAGISLAYRLTPRLSLRAGGDVEWLQTAELESGIETPDMRLWHYNAGVRADLAPRLSRWTIQANIGAGATTLDTDEFQLDEETGVSLSETYFTVNGGARVGYDLNRNVNFFLGTQAHVIFGDEDDTQFFADVSPEVEPFGTMTTFPIYVGANVSFPVLR